MDRTEAEVAGGGDKDEAGSEPTQDSSGSVEASPADGDSPTEEGSDGDDESGTPDTGGVGDSGGAEADSGADEPTEAVPDGTPVGAAADRARRAATEAEAE